MKDIEIGDTVKVKTVTGGCFFGPVIEIGECDVGGFAPLTWYKVQRPDGTCTRHSEIDVGLRQKKNASVEQCGGFTWL